MPTKHSYTQADLEYVQEHIKKNGFEAVAAYIGVNAHTLKKQISEWRAKGNAIPYMRWGVEIGEKRWRKDNGKLRMYIKTASGWRRVQGKMKPLSVLSSQKQRDKRKKKVKTQIDMPRLKEPKKEVAKLATKVPDLSKKIPVYIPERRLTIYVSQGADIEKVKQKYRDHYEFVNKKAV